METLASGAEPSLPAKQDASLLLSDDAIKQLKEAAALPTEVDDSGMILSDSAIMQLGRAAASPTAAEPVVAKPAARPAAAAPAAAAPATRPAATAPATRPAAAAPVPAKPVAAALQAAKTEKLPDLPPVLSPSGILRMAAGMRLPDEADPTRADDAVAEAVSKLEPPPRQPPRAVHAAITNLPTAILSPISPGLPDDRTSMDPMPPGAKKGRVDELAETAVRNVPAQILVQKPAPLPAGAAPLVHRPTSTGMVIVPTGGVLGGDIELPPEPDEPVPPENVAPASGRKAVVTRKAESTVHLDHSVGAKPTQGVATLAQPEETAIRQVFSRFAPAPDSREKMHPTAPPPPEAPEPAPRGGSWGVKLLVGLLFLGGVGAGGWYGTNWYLRDQQVRKLTITARSTYDAAFEHGRLADFVDAEAQLRMLSDADATDEAARTARALLLTATRFEFGGGPTLAGGSEWVEESLGAVRLIETEQGAVAQAALAFSALAQGELPAAEQHLGVLQNANTGEGRYRVPNGTVDYLASQVALLAGRDEQAVLALQRAVQKQRLPMWQRRLGYLLLRSGRDEEAIVALSAAQKRQEDLVGAQIDLAYARGRSGKRESLAEAKQALAALIDAPRSGPDPAGKLEHARAALFLADLTLRADAGARAAARELLTKAEKKAPATDVLFQEDLAQARLRIGDGEAAAAIVRELVNRLPQRRASRILLAQALVMAKQGSEALTALAPLTDNKDRDKADKSALDVQAQLLRAQALLLTRDTLAAQQVARQVMAATPATSPEHIGAQLLTGELFLKLGEPVSARRSIEPLMRLVDKDKGDKPASDGDGKPAGDRISPEQRVRTQLLWARTLLSMKPPQQAEARALLELVVSQSPDNGEARYLLGRLLRELGVWAAAEQQLTAAVHADDRLTSARRELAGLLMLRGDFGKARELYTNLLKDEQDADLLLAAARAQRLDGAPEDALATLQKVHRQTGEISGKVDEELLSERARALLLVGRAAEVVTVLTAPTADLGQLKKLTLAALLIRAHVSLAEGSQEKPELGQARTLFGKLPKTAATDNDVHFAEAELLIAEGKRPDANTVLTALIAGLQNIPPTSNGEDLALRQQAQKLLENPKN